RRGGRRGHRARPASAPRRHAKHGRRAPRRPPRPHGRTVTATAGRIDSPVPPSATLAINERIEQRVRDGADVLHLAFGEAGLPLLDSTGEILARAARRTGYGSFAGSPEARAAAAGWYERRGLPTDPDRILFAPGSKPL